MQRLLALAGRPEGRPLQDRSIGSVGGSTEKWRQATEISSCTRLEQRRRRERLKKSAESSQPRALRRGGGGRLAARCRCLRTDRGPGRLRWWRRGGCVRGGRRVFGWGACRIFSPRA